nr:magnesium transporter [Trichothermofontia sichuanensis]
MMEMPSPTRPNPDRAELQDLVRSQLQALLERSQFEAAKTILQPVQPADIADVIESLPSHLQAIAFRLLAKDEAIAVYEYLEPPVQEALLEDFKQPAVLEIINQMSPDDRVRLLDEMPAKVVRQLFHHLSPEEREATALLLGYKPETAGRIMTTEYVALKEEWTVEQALEHVRKVATHIETIYTLYVTDTSRHLSGILSLRELVVAQPDQLIRDIMTRDVICVHTDTDQEEVAHTLQHYDFLAVPVVDSEQRLVGIVTVDDVLDILEDEATEDIYTAGGVQARGDDYFKTNLFTVARRRVVWLLVLLLTNTLTSGVIHAQENVLAQVIALAAFIPLLIDTGGNIGSQSSTVVIRGLNTGDVRMGEMLNILRREAIAGTLLGLMLGVIVMAWAYVLQRGGDIRVGLTVGLSLFVISVLSAVAGTGLPFLFKALKFDPALMSAPFITTAVDVLGVSIYLGLARWLFQI